MKKRYRHASGLALVLSALSLCACSSSMATAPTTTTVQTTTTIPATTTTVTAVGGFISTQWCPQYEVIGDGSFALASAGAEIYYSVNAPADKIYLACRANLLAQSWTVDGVNSHQGLTGGFVQATQGKAWALIMITSAATPTVKVCTWPGRPVTLSCP